MNLFYVTEINIMEKFKNLNFRCKETPFFGNTLAGSLKEEQYKWIAAMVFGEYQLNIRPPSINLMDP